MKTAELNESNRFVDGERIATLRELATPALVFDEVQLSRSLQVIHALGSETSCQVLYALKACSLFGVLHSVVVSVDGLACSSLFESTLARRIVTNRQTVHFTSPGLRAEEVRKISEICDFVSLNSIGQWKRFHLDFEDRTSCGIRVNPDISFISDNRYDPCRKHSKLGVTVGELVNVARSMENQLRGLHGLHIHTNSDSSDFTQLLRTVEHVDASLSDFLSRLSWINLGGGYIFDEAKSLEPFYGAVDLLRSKYGLEVFIEPGASIVRKAGYLVSTVLDLFTSDGKEIAILDTTVNHMPEVFEYQYRPDVVGHVDGAPYEYILAGCSCLAGDLFGEYSFEEPLEIGSRVVFSDAGAYTLVKAHMFNGINLPTIYALKENGELEMKKRFTYEDFANRCGVDTNVFV